jgi:hypothetical protein
MSEQAPAAAAPTPAAAPVEGSAPGGEAPPTAAEIAQLSAAELAEMGFKAVKRDGKTRLIRTEKIDGKRVEIDATDRKTWDQYGKSSVLEKRYSEKAERADQLDKFLDAAAKDPRVAFQLLERLGHNVDDVAEARLREVVERKKLTPEQRESLELKERATRLERELQERNEREQMTAKEQRVAALRDQMTVTFKKAMARAGLPDNDSVLMMIGGRVHQMMQKGEKNPNVLEAAEYVRDHFKGVVQSRFQALDGDALLDYLGDETLAKIRKADVARATKGPKAPPPPVDTARRAPSNGKSSEVARSPVADSPASPFKS